MEQLQIAEANSQWRDGKEKFTGLRPEGEKLKTEMLKR